MNKEPIVLRLKVSPPDEPEMKIPMELELPTKKYPESLKTFTAVIADHCTPIEMYGLSNAISRGSIEELNYMAQLIYDLEEEQWLKLNTILELQNGYDYPGYDIEFSACDVINLVLNIDSIQFLKGIDTKDELGRLIYKETGKDIGELEYYLNYEEMGEDRMSREKGVIWNGYYVSEEMIRKVEKKYDSDMLPKKYKIKKG